MMSFMEKYFEEVKRIIDQDAIKTVSFDLFDTLLVRPAISRDDMLHLFSHRIESEYNINVEEERLFALQRIDNPYATIEEIWINIANRVGFSAVLANLFAQQEFEFERRFVSQRGLGKRIFDYAASKGKKIIAVSDMHFSSAQLMNLLCKCGYNNVFNIYVSCEYNAVKRTGALFKVLIDQGYIPDEILHIGDSRKADYDAPRAMGMQAFYLPRNTVLFKDYFDGADLLRTIRTNVYESVIYGFAINHLLNRMERKSSHFTLIEYAHLIIFPMLLHVSLFLLNESGIQELGKYQGLYFASRDGYLTKRAYDILGPLFDNRLKSYYLLTSRAACRFLIEDSFFERLNARFLPIGCTLEEFIDATVTDTFLRNKIISELDEHDLEILVCKEPQQCIELLKNYADELEASHKQSKQAAFLYYSDMFENATSVIIADCGFCGTISAYLTRAFHGNIKFDKAFFWENDKNQFIDDINGTKTYTAFSEKKEHLLGPQIESFFSEVSGSCLGFRMQDGTIFPRFEEDWQPEKMKDDIQAVQNSAIELIKAFGCMFGDILPLLKPTSLQSVMDVIQHYLNEEGEMAKSFNNIFFKEAYSNIIAPSSLGDLIAQRDLRRKDSVND